MFGINADGTFPEIGERYDIGLATRDGTSLSVLNKDGATVNVSRIAYMLSSDKQNQMKESTELQEKQKLVQLGSSEAIDREFDQWVQNTQGDWSGGLGQRVYGQQGVSNAYFDGEGLLWPINDYVPQVALRGPTQGLPATGISGPAGPDVGTQSITPGGASATIQSAGLLISLKPSATPITLVGVKGAYTTGTNTQVTPPLGQAATAGNTLVAYVDGQRRVTSGSSNLGDTGGATSSFDFSGSGSDNVIGTNDTFTVPGGGIYINSISCYMGGHTASVNTIFVVWNASNGAVVVNSSNTSLASGLSLKTLGVTQTFVAGGTVLRIGFWRQQNQDAMWGVAGSGSFTFATNQSGLTNPTNGCTSPYVCGNPQFYLSYSTSSTSEISTPAGWTQLGVINSPDLNQQLAIYSKVAAGGDAAPVFNAAVGARPMHGQCAEFHNVANPNVIDRQSSGTTSSQNNMTITNPATDTAAGDLLLLAGVWSLNGSNTAAFADSFNNNVTGVHLGDSGGAAQVNHGSYDYGIIPTGVAAFSSWAQQASAAGGWVEGIGMGYATTYLDNQGPPGHWHAVFYSGDSAYDVDLGANTGGQQGPLNMHIGGGYLWVLLSNSPNANTLTVHMIGCAYGSNTLVKLRSDVLPSVAGTSGFGGLIQASYVGGHLYVAVVQFDQNVPPNAPTANKNALFVLDYSAGTATAPSGLSAAAFIFPFTRGFKPQDVTWQGNNLIVSVTDGFNASIYQLSAPFSSIQTLAVIDGIANALVCTVGGEIFIIAWTPGTTGVNRLELYTLNGSTLTNVPFTPVVPFLDDVTSCVGFGPYALFAVSYVTPGGVAGQKTVTIYAFDVVRSRLFRALTMTDISWTGSDQFGHDIIGVFGTNTRTLRTNVTFQAQLGLAIFSGFLSNNNETAREFYWGVQPLTPAPSFTGLLQMGCDLISGLFDFTAATNKRFRAKIAHYIDGLVSGQSSPAVQLNAWIDQDPNALAPAPDFTTTTGVPPSPLPQQGDLFLYEGRLGRQTVYEVISSGGGYNVTLGQWVNAPKIKDVIVMAASGMVWDLVCDIAAGVGTNQQAQQEGAYTSQTTTEAAGIDHVAAYNFLKQLWKQRGGVCTLYLPNGETYNALIQLAEFASPKPLGAGNRSDQQATWQVLATLKIREDV